MEGVAEFLDAAAGLLVPACEPAVIRAVFETASSGYGGPRRRNGQRASVITPSGVPFEASVTGESGRATAALRYVTEAASVLPFFRPRLTAQRAALDRVVGWLPDGLSTRAGAELSCFVDTLFPDPGAVPARVRFATWFGIVHQPDVPAHLAGLKLYGVLFDGRMALDRLAARWTGFSQLSDLVAQVSALRPYMADLEVDALGEKRYKLYCLSTAGAAGLDGVARLVGAATANLEAELSRSGAVVQDWSRAFICCEAGDDRAGPKLSVHLPARALALDPAGMARLVRRLAQVQHGGTSAVDALDQAAARGAPGRWDYTVVGIGLGHDGNLGKLNVYLARGHDAEGATPR